MDPIEQEHSMDGKGMWEGGWDINAEQGLRRDRQRGRGIRTSMNSVSHLNECLGLNGSCLCIQSGSHVGNY